MACGRKAGVGRTTGERDRVNKIKNAKIKMQNYSLKFKNFISALAILAILLIGTDAISQSIKLKPISQLTEEQQAILAVRQAKASVVTVIGRQDISQVEILELTGGDPLVESTGTGFVWDESGIVVTNSHVVSIEDLHYSVVLLDGRSFPAMVLGTDRVADIAVLKIDAQGLVPAKLGNSDAIESGQTVFAIGNSLGKYKHTVTRGVVSGLARAVNVSGDPLGVPRLQDLIQTDAAINPGNSGGPLVNLLGEVVGMNTAVDLEGQNLGFAIPINLINDSVPQLRDLGKISRPRMGLIFRTVDDTVRIIKNWPHDTQGALVLEVIPAGPAAVAGILSEDLIIEINREQVTQENELDEMVRRHEAGDQVLVTLIRNGERIDMPLILGQFE